MSGLKEVTMSGNNNDDLFGSDADSSEDAPQKSSQSKRLKSKKVAILTDSQNEDDTTSDAEQEEDDEQYLEVRDRREARAAPDDVDTLANVPMSFPVSSNVNLSFTFFATTLEFSINF